MVLVKNEKVAAMVIQDIFENASEQGKTALYVYSRALKDFETMNISKNNNQQITPN
jgi:hypothetical protein